MTICANNSDDVRELAMGLANLPACQVLAHVHDLGLVRMPRSWLGVLMAILRKVRGTAGMRTFFVDLSIRDPDLVRDWMADTLAHVVDGCDLEDFDSVGGWSQREIDLLIARFPSLQRA